jgi:trans-aconitate methyltransferase
MSKWSDFYKDRMCKGYRDYLRKRYKPFLDLILENTKYVDYVAEIGCGAANITRCLIESGMPGDILNYLADNDVDMLALAKQNAREIDLNHIIQRADITRWVPPADLIHSHGVLGHFSDTDIRKIVLNGFDYQNFGGETAIQIHYVHSYKYEKPSFGDERLMTKEQWQEICEPDRIIEFNDGFDYILCWGI